MLSVFEPSLMEERDIPNPAGSNKRVFWKELLRSLFGVRVSIDFFKEERKGC